MMCFELLMDGVTQYNDVLLIAKNYLNMWHDLFLNDDN